MIEKVSTFKERLNEALEIRNKKPVELSRGTGISESTISQYRSGYAEPKEDKLAKIASYLRVNPTWLMGLNVSMETTPRILAKKVSVKGEFIVTELTSFEYKIIERYRLVDDIDKRLVLRTLDLEYEEGKDGER